MDILYQQLHPLSNDFAPIREKNISEFRGAARGVGKSSVFCVICANFV